MPAPQSFARIVRYTLVLTAGWIVMSGTYDLRTLVVGIAAAVVISWIAGPSPDRTPLRLGRLAAFVPWLIGQIILSNLRVVRLVLSRRMPIQPTMLRRGPGVTGDRALTLVGVSTTLTPGTLTVEIGHGEALIHALDAASAADVRDGVMARRVRDVFGEEAR